MLARRSSLGQRIQEVEQCAATSQDGSSLEFIAAIAGRQCYIQDASGRGLCSGTRIGLVYRILVVSLITSLPGAQPSATCILNIALPTRDGCNKC